MFLVICTFGDSKSYLWEEQDDGQSVWSSDAEDAIIFDTLSEAAESMLHVRGYRLRDLNVVPYTRERIPE